VRDALQSYLALAGGLTEITRQRAVAAAKGLVAQGEATADQVSALAEDLMKQTRQNSEAVASLVRYEVDRALTNTGLASVEQVRNELEARIRSLEETVRGLTGRGGAANKSPAEKAPVGPAASKAAASKAPAKKAAAKKTPAKKAAAKKAPAKKAAASTTSPTASSES
jgi:polyhydroxyalkanoate synthesis regulator phasin